LECNGDYLGNDRSSGRVVKFPNSLVLREEVINYSGPDIPFIWNEIPVQIAYTSDLQFVEECLLSAAIRDFEESYPQLANLKNKQWKPAVYLRINTFAWMEAVVSYPVKPKDATERRNRILKYALPLLNKEPYKVKFPEGTLR
jgi:small-conductance mechanosensitive channel